MMKMFKYSCGPDCKKHHEHFSVRNNPMGYITPAKELTKKEEEVLL